MDWEIKNENEVWLTGSDGKADELIGHIMRLERGEDHHVWQVSTTDGKFMRESAILEAAIGRFVEDGFEVPELREQRRRMIVDMRTRIYLTKARLKELEEQVTVMWTDQPDKKATMVEDISDLKAMDESFAGYLKTRPIIEPRP